MAILKLQPLNILNVPECPKFMDKREDPLASKLSIHK